MHLKQVNKIIEIKREKINWGGEYIQLNQFLSFVGYYPVVIQILFSVNFGSPKFKESQEGQMQRDLI